MCALINILVISGDSLVMAAPSQVRQPPTPASIAERHLRRSMERTVKRSACPCYSQEVKYIGTFHRQPSLPEATYSIPAQAIASFTRETTCYHNDSLDTTAYDE